MGTSPNRFTHGLEKNLMGTDLLFDLVDALETRSFYCFSKQDKTRTATRQT